MPLFSSSFKVGPDAPSTPSSANAKASRQLEFDYTVPPDQYQGQAAVAGTALPGTDHQKQGDTQTSPLFRPTPSKDSHTNALGIEGSPSSSQGQGQTPSQPPPGRLQELGLQHRPSNASDHPFDDDTEDEDLGAGVRLGQARRKGSSVSLATLDLATVQEQEEDESTNGLPIPRDQAYTTPPPIISHPVSPFSPAVSALGDVPTPTSHQNSPYTRSPRSSTGASVTISHNKENMDRHSPPSSPGGGRLRVSASPGRHHHGLSALSPLQGLSPMQPVTRLPHTRSVSGDIKDTSSVKGKAGGHARTHSTGSGSLSRSLSRRQSMYNSADSWREGREYKDENLTNPAGLFSRLTLVKAPGEAKGLRQRSKSSSALAPMALAPIGISAPVDIPATSPRATRRSFASSFGAMSPITPVRPVPTAPSTATDATNRISSYGEDAQARGKNYTPDEVLDMARSLASPVLLPAGGLKGADLKRRKSAGASFGRSNQGLSMSSSLTTSSPSPETKSAALEPVEYVQLDDETLLPYVDRPSEVKELMDHPGNVKIFEMLRAAFPKQAARKEWKDIQPTEWFWDELVLHLATIDRIECPDYAWVLRARLAVRRRSVALWEKVGTCLGCDDRLLQAGAEDPDGGATWGGLEDDDYHSSFRGQVWIEGLSPVDPEEAERAERSFREEFGDIVEDDDAATAGMTALLGTIGEGDEGGSGTKQGGPKRQTPAQRAGSRHQRDPLLSPVKNTAPLPGISGSGGAAYSGSVESIGASPGVGGRRTQSRSKSFVGLTIHSGSITSPPSFSNAAGMGMGVGSFGGSTPGGMGISMGMGLGPGGRSPMFSPDAEMAMPTYDRGPGQALFPTGFASLSAEPNLGRAASGLVGGIRPQVVPSAFEYGHGGEGGSRLMRRKSGTGLSESAITFASESEWSAGACHHD